MINPGIQHYFTMKYILRYLRGFEKDDPRFSKQNQDFGGILGYVDIDFADDGVKEGFSHILSSPCLAR